MHKRHDYSNGHRTRITLVTPRVIPPFARQDADLLSQSFEVEIFPVFGPQSVGSLRESIKKSDVVLIWFLGRHAPWAILLARLMKIPILSVIGGFEVAWVDSLSYGIKPRSWKEHVVRWMIAQSRLVLSVSMFSKCEAESRFPRFSGKFRLVPNAVDTARFNMPANGRRGGVISVGAINQETIGRKSWHLLADVAKRLPDVHFSIIGTAGDSAGRDFVRSLPSNVTWHGYLTTEQLIQELQEASVYVQPSVHEAFCVALAEAMSCGCFPVVSNLAALPEVVEGTGTLLRSLSADALVDAIQSALNRPESERATIRDRIVANYGTEKRARTLEATISEILSTKSP